MACLAQTARTASIAVFFSITAILNWGRKTHSKTLKTITFKWSWGHSFLSSLPWFAEALSVFVLTMCVSSQWQKPFWVLTDSAWPSLLCQRIALLLPRALEIWFFFSFVILQRAEKQMSSGSRTLTVLLPFKAVWQNLFYHGGQRVKKNSQKSLKRLLWRSCETELLFHIWLLSSPGHAKPLVSQLESLRAIRSWKPPLAVPTLTLMDRASWNHWRCKQLWLLNSPSFSLVIHPRGWKRLRLQELKKVPIFLFALLWGCDCC